MRCVHDFRALPIGSCNSEIYPVRSLIVCHVREKEKKEPKRPIEACPGRSNLLSHRCFATAIRLERGNIVEARRFL